MGLAIDGNVVHGIARGGQAFLPIDKSNEDGSITYNGQKYIDLANTSFKIDFLGSAYDRSSGSSASVAFTRDMYNKLDFSKYSFYQIVFTEIDDPNQYQNIAPFFSIKPNVQMKILTAANAGSVTPIIIDVLANNEGINVSCDKIIDYTGEKEFDLYGLYN